MLKSNVRKNIFLLLLLILIYLIIQNCASQQTASYYYAQKQIEHGDINFHHHLRVNEYLNAFPQDGIKAPKDALRFAVRSRQRLDTSWHIRDMRIQQNSLRSAIFFI